MKLSLLSAAVFPFIAFATFEQELAGLTATYASIFTNTKAQLAASIQAHEDNFWLTYHTIKEYIAQNDEKFEDLGINHLISVEKIDDVQKYITATSQQMRSFLAPAYALLSREGAAIEELTQLHNSELLNNGVLRYPTHMDTKALYKRRSKVDTIKERVNSVNRHMRELKKSVGLAEARYKTNNPKWAPEYNDGLRQRHERSDYRDLPMRDIAEDDEEDDEDDTWNTFYDEEDQNEASSSEIIEDDSEEEDSRPPRKGNPANDNVSRKASDDSSAIWRTVDSDDSSDDESSDDEAVARFQREYFDNLAAAQKKDEERMRRLLNEDSDKDEEVLEWAPPKAGYSPDLKSERIFTFGNDLASKSEGA